MGPQDLERLHLQADAGVHHRRKYDSSMTATGLVNMVGRCLS
jgi:hypothetical protein